MFLSSYFKTHTRHATAGEEKVEVTKRATLHKLRLTRRHRVTSGKSVCVRGSGGKARCSSYEWISSTVTWHQEMTRDKRKVRKRARACACDSLDNKLAAVFSDADVVATVETAVEQCFTTHVAVLRRGVVCGHDDRNIVMVVKNVIHLKKNLLLMTGIAHHRRRADTFMYTTRCARVVRTHSEISTRIIREITTVTGLTATVSCQRRVLWSIHKRNNTHCRQDDACQMEACWNWQEDPARW